MFSSNRFRTGRSNEVDPLLPSNAPSPEIFTHGSHGNESSEIKWSGNADPPQYTYNNTYSYESTATTPRNSEDEREDDSSDIDSISTRSSFFGFIVSIFTFIVFFGLVLSYFQPDRNESPQPTPRPAPHHGARTIEDRVNDILTSTPLIDGHDDLAWLIRAAYNNTVNTPEFRDEFENGKLLGHVDIARLRTGQVGGSFWSAFVGCPKNAGEDFSDENYGHAVAQTLEQIDVVRRLHRTFSNVFASTDGGADVKELVKQFHEHGKVISPVSIEGLHQVPPSAPMSTLRLYYELGVRMATLTWNCHNPFADAALIPNPNGKGFVPSDRHRDGLTERGKAVIHEMNRLGMLVDISHTSYWTQKAVMSNGNSRSPVVYSHSSAWEICSHPRNVRDDMLELTKQTNSLVMVNFSPDFISCTPSKDGEGKLPDTYHPNVTLHQVARHVHYIGEKIGYDHVGFGSDFDGVESLPAGLESVAKFPALVAELLRMGVSDEDMKKVVGGNLLRVWRAAEEVAGKMRIEGAKEGRDEL